MVSSAEAAQNYGVLADGTSPAEDQKVAAVIGVASSGSVEKNLPDPPSGVRSFAPGIVSLAPTSRPLPKRVAFNSILRLTDASPLPSSAQNSPSANPQPAPSPQTAPAKGKSHKWLWVVIAGAGAAAAAGFVATKKPAVESAPVVITLGPPTIGQP